MTRAAKWLRWLEIALTVAGISFLGGAFAATAYRWDYQARQERAIFHGKGAATPPDTDGTANPPGVASIIATSSGEDPVDPRAIGRIEIPRIGVRAIVREGADEETLALAVGHVLGTARPGESGNTVLAGHRDTFFRRLRDIRMNDQVMLVVPSRSYEYRVVSLEVIAPTETRVLDPTKNEELTLVTCYPFQYVGHATNRFVVRAARVQ